VPFWGISKCSFRPFFGRPNWCLPVRFPPSTFGCHLFYTLVPVFLVLSNLFCSIFLFPYILYFASHFVPQVWLLTSIEPLSFVLEYLCSFALTYMNAGVESTLCILNCISGLIYSGKSHTVKWNTTSNPLEQNKQSVTCHALPVAWRQHRFTGFKVQDQCLCHGTFFA